MEDGSDCDSIDLERFQSSGLSQTLTPCRAPSKREVPFPNSAPSSAPSSTEIRRAIPFQDSEDEEETVGKFRKRAESKISKFSVRDAIDCPSKLRWCVGSGKSKGRVSLVRVCHPDEAIGLNVKQEWNQEIMSLVQDLNVSKEKNGLYLVRNKDLRLYGKEGSYDQTLRSKAMQTIKRSRKKRTEFDVLLEELYMDKVLRTAMERETQNKARKQRLAKQLEDIQESSENENSHVLHPPVERDSSDQRNLSNATSMPSREDVKRLRAGDVIEYYAQPFVFGNREGLRRCMIYKVTPGGKPLLELQNEFDSFSITNDTMIRVVQRYRYRKLVNVEAGSWKFLKIFQLKESEAPNAIRSANPTRMQQIGDLVDKNASKLRKKMERDGLGTLAEDCLVFKPRKKTKLETRQPPRDVSSSSTEGDEPIGQENIPGQSSGDSSGTKPNPKGTPPQWKVRLLARICLLRKQEEDATRQTRRRRSGVAVHMTADHLELIIDVKERMERMGWEVCDLAKVPMIDDAIPQDRLHCFLKGDENKLLRFSQIQDTESVLRQWLASSSSGNGDKKSNRIGLSKEGRNNTTVPSAEGDDTKLRDGEEDPSSKEIKRRKTIRSKLPPRARSQVQASRLVTNLSSDVPVLQTNETKIDRNGYGDSKGGFFCGDMGTSKGNGLLKHSFKSGATLAVGAKIDDLPEAKQAHEDVLGVPEWKAQLLKRIAALHPVTTRRRRSVTNVQMTANQLELVIAVRERIVRIGWDESDLAQVPMINDEISTFNLHHFLEGDDKKLLSREKLELTESVLREWMETTDGDDGQPSSNSEDAGCSKEAKSEKNEQHKQQRQSSEPLGIMDLDARSKDEKELTNRRSVHSSHGCSSKDVPQNSKIKVDKAKQSKKQELSTNSPVTVELEAQSKVENDTASDNRDFLQLSNDGNDLDEIQLRKQTGTSHRNLSHTCGEDVKFDKVEQDECQGQLAEIPASADFVKRSLLGDEHSMDENDQNFDRDDSSQYSNEGRDPHEKELRRCMESNGRPVCHSHPSSPDDAGHIGNVKLDEVKHHQGWSTNPLERVQVKEHNVHEDNINDDDDNDASKRSDSGGDSGEKQRPEQMETTRGPPCRTDHACRSDVGRSEELNLCNAELQGGSTSPLEKVDLDSHGIKRNNSNNSNKDTLSYSNKGDDPDIETTNKYSIHEGPPCVSDMKPAHSEPHLRHGQSTEVPEALELESNKHALECSSEEGNIVKDMNELRESAEATNERPILSNHYCNSGKLGRTEDWNLDKPERHQQQWHSAKPLKAIAVEMHSSKENDNSPAALKRSNEGWEPVENGPRKRQRTTDQGPPR